MSVLGGSEENCIGGGADGGGGGRGRWGDWLEWQGLIGREYKEQEENKQVGSKREKEVQKGGKICFLTVVLLRSINLTRHFSLDNTTKN